MNGEGNDRVLVGVYVNLNMYLLCLEEKGKYRLLGVPGKREEIVVEREGGRKWERKCLSEWVKENG